MQGAKRKRTKGGKSLLRDKKKKNIKGHLFLMPDLEIYAWQRWHCRLVESSTFLHKTRTDVVPRIDPNHIQAYIIGGPGDLEFLIHAEHDTYTDLNIRLCSR